MEQVDSMHEKCLENVLWKKYVCTPTPNWESVYVLHDDGAQPLWEIPADGAQHVHLFTDHGRIYALAAFGARSRTSWLYEFVDDVWTPRYNFSSFGTLRFTSFTRYGIRYVIGAEYSCVENRADKRGPVLYEFRDGEVRYQHVLPVTYPTDVAVWSDYGTFHIGVPSELEVLPDGERNYHVNSSIFKWTDGNFRHHSLPTFGARDIEHFQIQSHFFVAVANHQNNEGSLNIYSEILRYNLGTGHYQPYQRLLTYGALRFRHFSWGHGVGAEHFLVVANQASKEPGYTQPDYRVNSVIYKFSRSQFVPFQCIPTVHVYDVLAVWGPRGEFVLVVVDEEGLKLYQYTGWRFVLVTLVVLPTSRTATPALSAFMHANFAHLTVGSPGGAGRLPTVYRLHFGLRRDLHDLHSRCMSWCQDLRVDLDALQPRVAELRSRLRAAPRTDQPISFASLTVNSAHSYFESVAVTNVRLQANVTLNSGLLERLNELRLRLQAGSASLASLQQQLTTAVTIDGNHTFSQGVVVSGSWHLNTASVGQLHGRRLNGLADVASFLSSVVWLNRAFATTSARLTFRSLVLRDRARLFTDSLSHVRPSSFVTLSGHHVITASKVMNGHVTAGQLASGRINGVAITADTVLIQGQLPDGVYQFGTVTATNLDVRLINGIDVWNLIHQSVSITNGTLTGRLVFLGPVVIQSASVNTINAISFDRLLSYGLTTTAGQTITGAWTIGSLHVQGELTLHETLNGIAVPDGLILINRPELSYRLQSLSFSSVTVQQLTVTDSLGPIKVLDGQLQLLLTSGDQLVSGKKTVTTLYLSGNALVDGLVNGVNISTDLLGHILNQTATIIDGNKVINGDVTFLSDLRVVRLNDLNISEILESSLKLTDSSLPALEFTDLVISGDLQTSLLNGLPTSDLVLADGVRQVVTANKVLILLSAASMLVGLINGVLLDSFYQDVLRTVGDQRVLSSLLFIEDTTFSAVTADSVSWQGYDLGETVTVRGTHTIGGSKIYTDSLRVAGLQVTDLWVDGLLDGVNLTALFAGAVNATHTVVSSSQTFSELVAVSSLSLGQLLNGVDLVAVLQSSFHLGDGVLGSITFDNAVSVGNFQFIGTFDGASSSDFGSAWLTTVGGQTFGPASNLTSSADLTVLSLDVLTGGVLNGVPGDQLFGDLIQLESDLIINGNVTIATLHSTTVTVEHTGVNMTDAVRQNQTQVFFGSQIFLGGLHVLGSASVTGHVNGVQLADVCDSVLLTDTPVNITRLTVRGNVVLHNTLDALSWTAHGLDLSRLGSLVWLTDRDVTLSGAISLTRPVLSDISVQTLLVGEPPVPVNLQHYLLNYWSVSRPVVVTGDVIFLGDVTMSSLAVDGLRLTGLLNGKNVSELLASALTVAGGTVAGHWTLPDLIIDGPLNISELNDIQVASLTRPNVRELHFTSHQVIAHLTIDGNLILPARGLVYGLDISEHFAISNFLLRYGNFAISSDVIFSTLAFTRSLTVSGTVNGVVLRESALLTRTTHQNVSGVTTLVHVGGPCLFIPDLTTPTINGVDIFRLLHSAVQLDRSYNITGLWTFAQLPSVVTYDAESSPTQELIDQLLQLLLRALARLRQVDQAVAVKYVTVVEEIWQVLVDTRERLQVASYLQYYVQTQAWQSSIRRFVPIYLGPRPDAATLLLAVWQRRIQIFRWTHQVPFGRWVEGPAYPEANVAWLAGLRRSTGTAHMAEARMAVPPTGAVVPDEVYRWDDPVLQQLDGAVNYIFLYRYDALVQSQAMPSHKTVDVKSFQPDDGTDCFLFVHFVGNVSHLACYVDDHTRFALRQTIETTGGRQAAVYWADDSACVAVANSRDGAGRVDLWCWRSGRLERLQTLAALAVSVDAATFHRHLILVVVEAATFKLDGIINVYRYESIISKFVHVQTVSVPGVTSARLLVLPSDELTLNCLTADGHVVYLRYRGWAWFQRRSEFSSGHATTLEAFNVAGLLSTQLAVAGLPRQDMLAITTHFPAAVYSGKFMGHEF